MKKIYLLFIAILFTSCSQNQNYLLEEGVVDIDYLKNSPKTYWFNVNFENYTVEKINRDNFYELYNYDIEITTSQQTRTFTVELPFQDELRPLKQKNTAYNGGWSRSCKGHQLIR